MGKAWKGLLNVAYQQGNCDEFINCVLQGNIQLKKKGAYGKAKEKLFDAFSELSGCTEASDSSLFLLNDAAGVLCLNIGYYDEGKKFLGKALSLKEKLAIEEDPVSVIKYCQKVAIHYQIFTKEHEEALTFYQKAMQLAEHMAASEDWRLRVKSREIKASLHQNMGLLLQISSNIPEALKHSIAALKIKEDQLKLKGEKMARTYHSLASLHKIQQNFDEAEFWCLEALEAKPDFPVYLHTLGGIYQNRTKKSRLFP